MFSGCFNRDVSCASNDDVAQAFMKNLCEELTEAEVKAMVAEADVYQDDWIGLTEFARMMKNKFGLERKDPNSGIGV